MDAGGRHICFVKGQGANVLGHAGPLASAVMGMNMSVFSTAVCLLLRNKSPQKSSDGNSQYLQTTII